jgi:hypothetical protein
VELSGRLHGHVVRFQVIADADALYVPQRFVSESHGLDRGRCLAGHLVLEATRRDVRDAGQRLVVVRRPSRQLRDALGGTPSRRQRRTNSGLAVGRFDPIQPTAQTYENADVTGRLSTAATWCVPAYNLATSWI